MIFLERIFFFSIFPTEGNSRPEDKNIKNSQVFVLKLHDRQKINLNKKIFKIRKNGFY